VDIRPVLIALLMSASATATADCGQAPTSMEYRSTPPLLAHEPDSALVVRIHEDGCISARFPRQDIRHGTYLLPLGIHQYRRVVTEIDSAGVRLIDQPSLQSGVAVARQQRAKTATTFFRVSDENIIEFEFSSTATQAATKLRFSSLRDDLLNLPHHPALLGIASAQQTFEDMANTAHEKGSRR
jgi:hypothetical protein